MADNSRKLGVTSLAAIVISAMVGGGIFSLPQNMAQSAAVMEALPGFRWRGPTGSATSSAMSDTRFC